MIPPIVALKAGLTPKKDLALPLSKVEENEHLKRILISEGILREVKYDPKETGFDDIAEEVIGIEIDEKYRRTIYSPLEKWNFRVNDDWVDSILEA